MALKDLNTSDAVTTHKKTKDLDSKSKKKRKISKERESELADNNGNDYSGSKPKSKLPKIDSIRSEKNKVGKTEFYQKQHLHLANELKSDEKIVKHKKEKKKETENKTVEQTNSSKNNAYELSNLNEIKYDTAKLTQSLTDAEAKKLSFIIDSNKVLTEASKKQEKVGVTEQLKRSSENENAVDNIQPIIKNEQTVEKESDEEVGKINKRLERRKKYMKKWKKKQKQPQAEKKQIINYDSNHPAVMYLHKWKSDKANWSFSKVRQTWLLQHMYDKNAIPDELFSIFLEYLGGSQGNARTKTLQEAEKYFEDNCDNDEIESNKVKLQRCHGVIQSLSEEL